MRVLGLALLLAATSALVVTPAGLRTPAVRTRTHGVEMARKKDAPGEWTFDTKNREKVGVPVTKKADDKSWGVGELFAGWGGRDDAGPDTGPKLGGGQRDGPKDRFDTSRFDRRSTVDTGKSEFKWPWQK